MNLVKIGRFQANVLFTSTKNKNVSGLLDFLCVYDCTKSVLYMVLTQCYFHTVANRVM